MKTGMCKFLQCTSLKSCLHFDCTMLHVPAGIFIVSFFKIKFLKIVVHVLLAYIYYIQIQFHFFLPHLLHVD